MNGRIPQYLIKPKLCKFCGNKIIKKIGPAHYKRTLYCNDYCRIESRKSTNDDFFKYVFKTDSCWIWEGHLDSGGYGHLTYRGKMWKAHRLSYFIKHGEFNFKLKVCHSCDNPKCVNPDHLWLGTQADNIRDMVNKKRNRNNPLYGEKNHLCKYSDKIIDLVRKDFETGLYSQAFLSKKYGISPMQIHRIVKYKNRKPKEKNEQRNSTNK